MVLIVKETHFCYVVRFGRSIGSIAVEADVWRHRADVLTSIAAFVGISIALIGGEKRRGADNWAAIFVCLVIATIRVRIFRPPLFDIFETAPPGPVVHLVRQGPSPLSRGLRIGKDLSSKIWLMFFVDF